MAASGQTAWESADILPWSAWVRRTWDDNPGPSSEALTVLTNSQLILVWQDIIRADVKQHYQGESPLWDIATTARAATQTLGLVRQWCLECASLPPTSHPDHAGFRRWLEAWEALCARHHWTDSYRLADLLTGEESTLQDQPLTVTGYDLLTTQQQRLLDRLSQAGIEVEVVSPPYRDFEPIPCHIFPTPDDQWRAVAHWTRKRLIDNPDARIAVVLPDLREGREGLVSALMDTLAPGQVVHPRTSRELPFHVSLGDPLSRHPIGRSLTNLLGMLAAERMDLPQSEALLRCPWIAHSHEELIPRSTAALALRQQLPWEHTPWDLLRALESLGCPRLEKQLERALTFKDTAPSLAPLAKWIVFISSLLDIFGWPGDDVALNSDHYQAVQSIRQQIMELGTLELIVPPVGLSRAIGLLDQLLGSRVFQPEAGGARVHVIGSGETPGLEFDHIWFADLVEERWPLPEIPDPFLPVSLQREAGCPHADPVSSVDHAKVVHGRLAAVTPELIQSRPASAENTLLIASPLVAHCPQPECLPERAQTLFRELQPSTRPIVSVDDTNGPPSDGHSVSGGTGLIQQQSICPRGAFLRYRLGGKDHTLNQTGLNPAQRGAWVHQVLDRIWGELQNSRTLQATSRSSLHSLIASYIDQTAEPYRMASGGGAGFYQVQRDWLLAMLGEWFDLERHRTLSFQVIGREVGAHFNLEGLELTFRIDRIDQFDNGSLLLIDYKTGQDMALKWFEDRPSNPQLPLYALSQGVFGQGHVIAAIAYARVRAGECVLAGHLDPGILGLEDGGPSHHPDIRLKPCSETVLGAQPASLNAQQAYWGQTLGALAREFLDGDARINPGRGGICPDCPTPAFCRWPPQGCLNE